MTMEVFPNACNVKSNALNVAHLLKILIHFKD
jgi:hypothetical protein